MMLIAMVPKVLVREVMQDSHGHQCQQNGVGAIDRLSRIYIASGPNGTIILREGVVIVAYTGSLRQ